MEWDWQFLTPSSTPTSASFECNSLQTPRLNAHFQDAFSPYGDQHQHQHQYQNQHQHTSETPSGPALDYGDHSLYPQPPQQTGYSQHYEQQQQQQVLQPAFAPQPQNTGSHGLAPSAPIGKEPQGMVPNPGMYPNSADLYQMHTPPPTRGSSTKRRSQRVEAATFGTPSSMTARRPQQPAQQAHMTGLAPPFDAPLVMMPQQDLSQSQYQFPQMPAASQVLELQPSMTFAQPRPVSHHSSPRAWPSAALDDPFLANQASITNRPLEQPAFQASSGLRRTGSRKSRQLSINTTTNPNYGGHYYPDRSSPVKMHATSASVDPSLVYSSPSRPATSESVQSSTSSRPASAASVSRVPYQHSLSDPRQEIEIARTNRLKPPPQQAQPPVRQYAQSFPSRPELHRSNTVSGLRSSTGHANPDQLQSIGLTRSNSATNLPRRSSPLKRERGGSRVSLCSISETPKPALRTSVILTVDANGTARTETRVSEPSPTRSTRSIRDKYPNLWEDSDSDSDPLPLRTTPQWPSRNSSLAQARGEERHAKMAKLDPPLEDLENLHLPRSNSSASLASLKTPSKAAYAAAAQLRRQTSAKKQPRQSMHTRRNTLASLNSSFESLPSVDLSSSDDRSTQTDAGSALRQMMASRGSNNGDMQQVQQDPCNVNMHKPLPPPPPPPMMYEPRKFHQKSQSFAAPVQNYGHQSFDRAHGYAVDCAPMQPAQPPQMQVTNYMSTPIFRCICNLPLDDGRGTLQCSFCAMYLHAACLNMDPQRLPATYVCNFCSNTANTIPPNSAQTYAGWGIAGM